MARRRQTLCLPFRSFIVLVSLGFFLFSFNCTFLYLRLSSSFAFTSFPVERRQGTTGSELFSSIPRNSLTRALKTIVKCGGAVSPWLLNRPDLEAVHHNRLSAEVVYGLTQSVLVFSLRGWSFKVFSPHRKIYRRMVVRLKINSHPCSASLNVTFSKSIYCRCTLTTAARPIGTETPDLGLCFREDSLLWVRPINDAPWNYSGPLSCKSLRPSQCILTGLERGPNADKVRPSSCAAVKKENRCFNFSPPMISLPRYQNSSCRGQERSYLHMLFSLRVSHDPSDLLSRFDGLICRGLSSEVESLVDQGTVDYPSLDLIHLNPLIARPAADSLRTGTSSSSSYLRSHSTSYPTVYHSHQARAWQLAATVCLLSDPPLTRCRYSDFNGRGLQVSLVSIPLVFLGDISLRALVKSVAQMDWSVLIIAQITRSPRLNGRGHHETLGSDSFDWLWIVKYQSLGHGFRALCISWSNPSFKKRLQVSSLRERVLSSPSFLGKERTLPSTSSVTEFVFQRSKVLKILRAMCVVRSPLLAEELDFDLQSIISETFWQKFPVFVYDDYRHSILALICTLMFVASEKLFGKEPPLVS